MDLFRGVLLAVRFGLELGALAALGYWGLKTGESTLASIALGVCAVAAAIALWALFVSPKARFEHPALKAVFEIVVFGGAATALWAAGRTTFAVVFATVAVVDTILVYALDA